MPALSIKQEFYKNVASKGSLVEEVKDVLQYESQAAANANRSVGDGENRAIHS